SFGGLEQVRGAFTDEAPHQPLDLRQLAEVETRVEAPRLAEKRGERTVDDREPEGPDQPVADRVDRRAPTPALDASPHLAPAWIRGDGGRRQQVQQQTLPAGQEERAIVELDREQVALREAVPPGEIVADLARPRAQDVAPVAHDGEGRSIDHPRVGGPQLAG